MSRNETLTDAIRELRGPYEVVVTRNEDGDEQLTITRLGASGISLPQVPREELLQLACRIYDTRRARSRHFKSSLLGEPVWDMLLALFCLPRREKRLSITATCYAAEVPASTGLRYIGKLEREGLVARSKDSRDGRRVYLELTPKGEQLMLNYLQAIYDRMNGS